MTFSATPGGFGDEVVGLTTNSHTSVCVPTPSADQLLGTGRQLSGADGIGRDGFPIEATFQSPLAGPVEVSVDLQSLAAVDVRLRLFDALGDEVGSSSAVAQLGSGFCVEGLDRARTSLTASSSASVASAVMDVIGNSVLVIDNFSFVGGTIIEPPATPTIDSHLAATVPKLDGKIGIGEWDTGNKLQLGNGFMTVKNDGRRLYVLLDMIGVTATIPSLATSSISRST